MANENNNGFMDSIVDAQKQVMDTVVENTKKFANGNTTVNDTLQKGSEWYKNWLENQKNVFTQTVNKTNTATATAKENASGMNEFYQNWYNTQLNNAKQIWETSSNFAKNGTTATDNNPMTMFNNWTSWMNNMAQNANTMNQAQQWQSNMQNQMQNMFNMDSWKNAGGNFSNVFNQYSELMNSNIADWQKNLQSGTIQDAYKNMVNVSEGFTRFAEMWAPMMNSIKDKTFNMDMYKQWANPTAYKEMMDKYFGFLPESSRNYMQQMSDMMSGNMKQFGQTGMNGFQQMRGMMGSMPGVNASEVFGNMMNSHNTWNEMMSNAFSPFAKIMPTNKYTKSMSEWSDISNRIMVYNIKNSEMQYMIYNQGAKVMDMVAENIAKKVEDGTEVHSMMALYQEWLNISDKVYVSLFESDEYSKLMAEVSAMEMKLKKDIEGQMEKMLVGLPVATRSDMDEMYKTIYDLKKQVRELEKALETNNDKTEEKAAPKAKKA